MLKYDCCFFICVLLLCNGDISKWSNSFARCVKIRNYRVDLLKAKSAGWQQIKAISFQDYNLGGEKCLGKLMSFIYY